MGTRSIHGIELKPKQLYCQHMNLDGMPQEKGAEYFHSVVKVISHGYGFPTFCHKQMPHQQEFPAMVKCLLNWWQWCNPNNYKNHCTVTLAEWAEWHDAHQWQYLWCLNGDYQIWSSHGDKPVKLFVIPWAYTYLLCKHWSHSQEVFLKRFWESLGEWHTREEVQLPLLEIEYGEVCAYPDQKGQGWREYAIARLNGGDLADSMFASEVRKQGVNSQKRNRLIVDGKKPALTKVT